MNGKFNLVLSTARMRGGSSSTFLLDRVESKDIRLINAPHLISQLPSLKLRHGVASLSLYFTGTILVGVRWSLTIVFLVPKTGDILLGLPLPHMNIVWSCATTASITGNLWNSLPPSTFPSSYDLSNF